MEQRSPRRLSVAAENRWDGLVLAIEGLAWLAGWLLLPAWLGLGRHGVLSFGAYAVVASLLLVAGVGADRGDAFASVNDVLWFAGLVILAMLCLGGAVFGLARLLNSVVFG